MNRSLDRRVIPEEVLGFIRACQERVPAHLAGGAALSGAYLSHRLSGDIDLFCHRLEHVRALVSELPAISQERGVLIDLVRDAGSFVRARVRIGEHDLELDLVHEAVADIEPPPPPLDGVVVESFTDLRAAKLTCVLSRSEPRDLVDLLYLDRAGFPPEKDLVIALRKDGGIDPGVLAWLLGQFPVRPLPRMLEPLTEAELEAFRDALRERFQRMAVPEE